MLHAWSIGACNSARRFSFLSQGLFIMTTETFNATSIEQANEALVRQIADDLDNGALPEGKVIYNGSITTRANALRSHDEAIVTARKSTTFDIQDTIDDYLVAGPARLRLRSNMLWGMGYRVIGAVRDVVYRMSEHAREVGHINKFNDYLAELNDAESSADYAEQLGYAHYGSGMNKARALFTIYSQWHDLTVQDFGKARVKIGKNELPILAELAAQPPRYDASEAEKMMVATRMMLEGEDPAVIDEAVQLVFAKASEEHKMRVLNNATMAPILERLVIEASEPIEGLQFYDLPLNTQQAIISSAANSVRKIPTQLAKMRSVSTMDMVTSIPMLKRLGAKLDDVLNDPRFE
jgi:hypothetical protein